MPGSGGSAPLIPQLLPKMLATTVIASIVFAFVYVIVVHRIITLDDIPFFPATSGCSRAVLRAKKKARRRWPCFSNTDSFVSRRRSSPVGSTIANAG